MVRTIVAGFVGAIIVFIWGFMAWAMLDLWGNEIRSMPGDGTLEKMISEQVPEDGAYYFPGFPDGAEMESAEAEDWYERHRAGPIGMLLIRHEGDEPMQLTSMLGGFLISLLGAIILSGVLAYVGSLGSSYGGRVTVGIFFALFAIVSTYAMQWNWFYWPGDYAKALSLDVVIGWVIAVVVMAAIVGGVRSKTKLAVD